MTSLTPVDAASVWTSATIPEQSAWSFELTPDQRQALIACGRNQPGIDLRASFAPCASEWTNQLHTGCGFLRLSGFPIAELTETEVQVAYIKLGALLGTPAAQDRDDNLITHIRDERLPTRLGRTYQTNLSQGFHSDASDLVALLCIRPAMVGGLSRIVSSHAVYNEILRRAPHLLAIMYQPMPWSRHTDKHEGGAPFFELAPITDVRGIPRIFLIPWYIRHSQRHAEAPRLTVEQLAALNLFDQIVDDPNFQITMEFQTGDVQFLNNTTVLHSRDAYADPPDPALRRHLLRLWLTMESDATTSVFAAASPRR